MCPLRSVSHGQILAEQSFSGLRPPGPISQYQVATRQDQPAQRNHHPDQFVEDADEPDDPLQLVAEYVSQCDHHRNRNRSAREVSEEEAAGRNPERSSGQIHQRAKSREESRVENRKMAMAMHEGMHPIGLVLGASALEPKTREQLRSDPATDEVQRVVTRDHTKQRDDESERIACDALVGQETAYQQRDILGHRQAQPAQRQDHEQSQIGEVFDVR